MPMPYARMPRDKVIRQARKRSESKMTARMIQNVALFILFLILVLMPLVLSGCVGTTTLMDNEIKIYSNTGKGCVTERGETKTAQGSGGAEANVLQQSGTGQAQGSLDTVFISKHDCTDQEDQSEVE